MSPLSHLPENNIDLHEEESLLKSGEWPAVPIIAHRVGDKIIVFDHILGSLLYGFGRFFGIPVGIRKPKHEIFERPLELSYFETYYLLRKNRLSVKKPNNEFVSNEEFLISMSSK